MLAQVPQPMQRPSMGTTQLWPSRFSILRAAGPTISLHTRTHSRQRMHPSGRGPRSTPWASARSRITWAWGAIWSSRWKAWRRALTTASEVVETTMPSSGLSTQESSTASFPLFPVTPTAQRRQAPEGRRAEW